jgi:hypothetical protein
MFIPSPLSSLLFLLLQPISILSSHIFSSLLPNSLFMFLPFRLSSLSFLLLQPYFFTLLQFFLSSALFSFRVGSFSSLLPFFPVFNSFLLLSHPFHSTFFSLPSLLSSRFFLSLRPYSLFVFNSFSSLPPFIPLLSAAFLYFPPFSPSSAFFSFRVHSSCSLLPFIPLTSALLLYFPPIFSSLWPYSLFMFIPSPLSSFLFLLFHPYFSTFLPFFPLFGLILFLIHSLSALLPFIPLTSALLLYFPPIFSSPRPYSISCSFLLLSPLIHSSHFFRILFILPPLFSVLLLFLRGFYYSFFRVISFIPLTVSSRSFLSLLSFSLRPSSFLLLSPLVILFYLPLFSIF